MTGSGLIKFSGLQFLEELEKVFYLEGLEGVSNLVKTSFPIGGSIKMISELDKINEQVYKIEYVTVEKTNPSTVLFSSGMKKSDSIIRSIGLSYVDEPFQINIYGRLME